MNRKILGSAISIMSILALMGGATFAFFSDTGTSSANTFSTGTLDLKLTDNNETALDSVTATFGGTLTPGTCTGDKTLELMNSGTVAANHVEVRLTNLISDSNTDASPDMDRYLKIDKLQYDGGNVGSQIPDLNSDGVDLSDWAASTGLDNLALSNLGVNHTLVVNICLSTDAPNEIQGDSVTSTFTVELNQNASQ